MTLPPEVIASMAEYDGALASAANKTWLRQMAAHANALAAHYGLPMTGREIFRAYRSLSVPRATWRKERGK